MQPSRITLSTLAIVIVMTINASAQTPKKCGKSITSCGCTITEPGVYTVDADLNSTQGLTPLQGCIDVAAKVVSLFTNGHAINGPAADGTGTIPSGIGIHLLSSASMIFLEGKGPRIDPSFPRFTQSTTILGWQYGLESEASNVISDDFGYTQNITGVLLQKAINNNINDLDSRNNSAYGVWVKSSVGNQINCAGAENNTIAGVYVGCSATGPMGAACSKNDQASKFNSIYDYSSFAFTFGSLQAEQYGIALEKGSEQNTVTDNFVHGNTIDDLFDGNPKCDSNVWRLNDFSTANRSCIQ